jgi:excisionase family DNA binding protein
MATTVPRREPIVAGEEERQFLSAMTCLLNDGPEVRLLTGGKEVVLPESARRALLRAVEVLAGGSAVALVPLHREMTTQEAADVLNVSRPYLIQMLDRGEMPYTRIGTHRRIRFEDVVAYKRRRDAERRKHLDTLVDISEDLGLYEREVREACAQAEDATDASHSGS